MKSLSDLWDSILARLSGELSDMTIKTWFDEITVVTMEDSALVLHCSNPFKKNTVEARFLPHIKAALKDIFSTDLEVKILSDEQLAAYHGVAPDRPGNLFDSDAFTFETYVVGPQNKLAYAAAKAVAEKPAEGFNPLFIYGESGLGKTHLLYAIAHLMRSRRPESRIVYIKGDDFTNELVSSIRENRNAEFREKYRQADILLVDDLTKMEPKAVYFEGTLVAENKRLLQACRVSDYPDWIKDTVHFKKPITAASFRCFSKDPKAKETTAHVIGLIDVQIINHDLIRTLPVKQGEIQRDLSQDILKQAVVERYGKTGGVGVGFVQGFTLKKGALAYSMSHDHHNIVTVGVSDSDMAVAVNEVARLHGGLAVVCDGNVMDSMCLPIGGLMSECGADEVMRLLDGMNEAVRQLGCQMPAPFMTLSFISLPTVPELGLTDMGLVDVLGHRLIDVETQGND